MKIPLQWLKDYVKTDASPREIAAGFTQLGLMLDKPLDESGVLDLEHRMDRSDWLSIIGCARDYAAFSKLKLKYPKTNDQRLPRVKPSEMVEITVKTPHVRRFKTLLVKNVKVGESPSWLKDRLNAYGIKSINNVVDITNFVMVEYGQPMHAQDLSRLKKREITLRSAKNGEQLTTILGTKVNLDPETFILSSGGVPTVIGGIVGGQESSVTNSTTELILDAGNYDQSAVRKTSRRLKIINETVSRYDKFLHPQLCEIALERATTLLVELTGASVYDNFDYYPNPPKPETLTLHYDRLKLLSGMTLPLSTIKRILTALEYQISKETKDTLTLTIPYFRTDVEVEDDVVADILRINDYASIPTSSLTTPVPTDITPSIMRFEDILRDLLVAQGLHEHITTTLVKDAGSDGEILLSNALSSDQNALRTSLLPKLREIVSNYGKHKLDRNLVFEIGKVFHKKGDKYLELRELAVVGRGDTRSSLSTLMHQLGITYHIDNNYQIIINKQINGQLHTTDYRLDTSILLSHYHPYGSVRSDYLHSQTRDLSVLVPQHMTYADLSELINEAYPKIILSCKDATTIKDQKNYLLTLTWSSDTSNDPDKDLVQINSLLTKSGVISKS